MRARERDISADGSADERQDDEPVDFLGKDHLLERFTHGGGGAEALIEHHGDHDEAKDLGETVHCLAHLLAQEEPYRDGGAYDCAVDERKVEEDLESHRRAADVADVEDESAERDGEGQEVPESGQHLVRDVLRPHSGNGQDTPDIELNDDIDEN